METVAAIIFFTFLSICLLGLLVCFGALSIIKLSKYNKFFLKVYLFFFVHEDYKTYKEVKKLIKENRDNIKVCSSFVETNKMQGYYFLVHEKCISLWKDNKPIFVTFHQRILDEFIELGGYMTDILCIRESDDCCRKQIETRIKEIETEI